MTSLQNLFVAKLPRNLTDADLQKIFVDYNPSSAKVMLDAATGKSKGFGFVLFESEDAGKEAYEKLNRTHVTLHGHNFNLCIFPSKHDGKVATEENNALFVRNIPSKLSQGEVEEFLRGFGPLTYCAMREDRAGNNVWVVYAEYDTIESAKNALENLHGNRSYFNSPIAVLAKYADSDEARKERRRRREESSTNGTPAAAGHGAPANNDGNAPAAPHGGEGNGPAAPPTNTHYGNHALRNGSNSHHTGGMQPGAGPRSQRMPPSFSSGEPHHDYAPYAGAPGNFANMTAQHYGPSQPHYNNGGGALPSTMAPPPPQSVSPIGGEPQYGYNQPTPQQSTTPLTQPFLNVTFNPGATNNFNSGGSFPHYGGYDNTPSRGSTCTPLNFSFSHEFDQSGSGQIPSTAMEHQPQPPVRRSSNLSTGGTYRHNPYAPVTPVSSAASSTGPSTPLTASMPHQSPSVGVHVHYGTTQQRVPMSQMTGVPSEGFAGNHFSSGASPKYLSAGSPRESSQ